MELENNGLEAQLKSSSSANVMLKSRSEQVIFDKSEVEGQLKTTAEMQQGQGPKVLALLLPST